MATLTGSSAVLLVADIDRSVEYYRGRLGFTCDVYGEPPDFIVATRDEVKILMALCEDAERIVPNWRIVPNVWNVFIRVDDVELLQIALERRLPQRGTKAQHRQPDRVGACNQDGDLAVGEQVAHALRDRLRAGAELVELGLEVVQKPPDPVGVGGLRSSHLGHVATPTTYGFVTTHPGPIVTCSRRSTRKPAVSIASTVSRAQ